MKADRDNIATFVEVVRRQSLAAAARHLGVPKSTVSRRLARLEEQLDIQLVHRDARRLAPTSEGTRLFDAVVDAIDALDAAVEGVEQRVTEPRGTIRLTAAADLGRMLLLPALVRFLERYPEISLDLIFTTRFVDIVQERIDVAVRAGAVTEPNLIARRLMRTEFQLAARPGYAPSCHDVRDLQDHPFVTFGRRGQSQVLRLERGRGEEVESVEVTVSGSANVDDYSAMVELVAAGQGIGLMPELHVSRGVSEGRLVRLLPEWSLSAPSVQLVYPTRRLPERVRLLLDFLVEELGDG